MKDAVKELSTTDSSNGVSISEESGVSEEGKKVYLMIAALLSDAKAVLDKRDETIKQLEKEITELKSEVGAMKIRTPEL